MLLTIGSNSSHFGDKNEYYSLYLQTKHGMQLIHNGTKQDVYDLYEDLFQSVLDFDGGINLK